MTKAVFLDRDGVVNEAVVRHGKPYPPSSLADVRVPEGTSGALEKLRRHGFRLIVVTNQPDVARGTTKRAVVDEINRYLSHLLAFDAVEVCDHDDSDGCDCRKPRPGMLLRAAQRDGIDLASSYMVGDRWRDIEAGRRAGCRTVLIGDGYNENTKSRPDAIVTNLSEAVGWILAQSDMDGQR